MSIRILEMTLAQLCDALGAAGHPGYRADQLTDWVYRKGVSDLAAMSNVPKAVLADVEILTSRVIETHLSVDGTLELLLACADGERIETVLIPADDRVTACLSTQVGCGMGCTFCATGLGGLRRNLCAGEILEQLLHLRSAADGKRITNVVLMGMGEPLANFDATVSAVRAIIDPDRFGISARSVTVSTVGLPKQIRKLARENLPITLAISLHAPNDALRRELIPVADRCCWRT